VFDQRFEVKRKIWKDPPSHLLKAKVFGSITYAGRIVKENERA
jgi:hypothetical protein